MLSAQPPATMSVLAAPAHKKTKLDTLPTKGQNGVQGHTGEAQELSSS